MVKKIPCRENQGICNFAENQGKIWEFQKILSFKVKIFKFYSSSDVATRGSWRPYIFTSFDFDYHESKLAHVHHILDKFSFN